MQRSGWNRRTAPISGARVSNAPSKSSRKRSSSATAIRRSGRYSWRSWSAGVVRAQSPRERSRMMDTLLFRGRLSSTLATLLFDLGLVHQHHRDIVADGVHAVALDALEPAA